MSQFDPVSLSLGIRVFPFIESTKQKSKTRKPAKLPVEMLVFDTETRIDATQRLTFGSYRFVVSGECQEEGLFYGKDLSQDELGVLRNYVARPKAISPGGMKRQLDLLTCDQFLKKIYRDIYKNRFLLVGFNFPFDISRLAHDYAIARRQFAGGFSLGLWSFEKDNAEHRHHYRPRLGIKYIDSKRALKGFTSRKKRDFEDKIPEGSDDGLPEEDYVFKGHFLDLRTLAFALTDKSYSLESACEAFNVEHGKQAVKNHGVITPEYIDYNRRDVLATSELAEKLFEEYDKHSLELPATQAYSSASVGKAYLRKMGITPILERQSTFPKKYLGYAQSAFFGGRTSAHIRKVVVPVVYTDFLSMYPTVNRLMDLWKFVTAGEIKVVEHCEDDIDNFLRQLKPEKIFDQNFWKQLHAFVRIIPNGDILPSRAKYNSETNDWQVAVNYLYSQDTNPENGLWYSLPDVVASVILTGNIPKIVDAFRLVPQGKSEGSVATQLAGVVSVDPAKQDFFKTVIEERKRLSTRSDLSGMQRKRADKSLKVLANAASYGIYAEMNRRESGEEVDLTCFGIDPDSYACRVAHPDTPGKYCFPPIASLITGAARLMLALLEYCVITERGTYAMEDTDSMAIVATESGDFVPCPGGNHRMKNGTAAVKALSWEQVRKIVDKFAALNPYDRKIIKGSILKIEDDNYVPKTATQRQIWCVAISAKRYALFLKDECGNPVLLRERINSKDDHWSEHGLGHLLNPTDLESEDRVGIPVKVNVDSGGKANAIPCKVNSNRSEATLASLIVK